MKDKEKKWSIISNLAIIISLIFVIYELRLNHEALVEANLIAEWSLQTMPIPVRL